MAIITRYCPWWLSVEFGRRNNAIVPREAYEALPEAVKIFSIGIGPRGRWIRFEGEEGVPDICQIILK